MLKPPHNVLFNVVNNVEKAFGDPNTAFFTFVPFSIVRGLVVYSYTPNTVKTFLYEYGRSGELHRIHKPIIQGRRVKSNCSYTQRAILDCKIGTERGSVINLSFYDNF